jgi:hypothetical protein
MLTIGHSVLDVVHLADLLCDLTSAVVMEGGSYAWTAYIIAVLRDSNLI